MSLVVKWYAISCLRFSNGLLSLLSFALGSHTQWIWIMLLNSNVLGQLLAAYHIWQQQRNLTLVRLYLAELHSMSTKCVDICSCLFGPEQRCLLRNWVLLNPCYLESVIRLLAMSPMGNGSTWDFHGISVSTILMQKDKSTQEYVLDWVNVCKETIISGCGMSGWINCVQSLLLVSA